MAIENFLEYHGMIDKSFLPFVGILDQKSRNFRLKNEMYFMKPNLNVLNSTVLFTFPAVNLKHPF